MIGEENNDREENPRSRVYLPFGFRKKSIPNPYTARDADLDRLVLEGISTVNLGRGIPDPTPFGVDSGLMRSQSRGRLTRTIERLTPKNRSDSGAMADEKKPATPWRNETPYGGDQTIIEHAVSEARFQKDLASKGQWKEIHYDHYDWWAYPIDRGSAQHGDFYNVAGEPIKRLRNNMDFIKALTDTILVQTRALGYNLYEKTWMQDPEWEKGQDWGLAYPTRIWKMTRSAQIFGLGEEFESLINMQKVLQESGIRFNHRKYWENPGTVDDVPPIESYDEPKTYSRDYSFGAKPQTPSGEGVGSSPYYPTEYEEWEAGIDTEPRVDDLESDDFESAVAGAFELADLLREKSKIGDLEYPYHHIPPDRREDIADTIDFALTLIPVVEGDGFDTDRKETADALEKFVVGDDLYRDDSELLDELILQLRDSTYDGFFSFGDDSGRMSVEPKMNRFNDRVTTLYNEGKTREEIAKELDLSVRQVGYLLNKLFAGGLAKSRHTQREKTEELIERVATMHNEGKRTTEIAKELGLTNNRVQRYQYIARRRGLLTARPRSTTAEIDELMNEAARLYNEGKPRMDIAKEMNLPAEKIGTLLQRANERNLIRDYNPQGLGNFGKTILTPEKIAAAAAGYKQGKTFAQIAEELAVTETGARKLVVQARRLGLDTGSPRRRTPSEMEELLLEVAVGYEEGKTFAEIGRELDVAPSAIRGMVDRAVTLGLIERRERTRSDTGASDSGSMELPDGIDEELEDYVYDDPLFGPSIKHPLFFWIAPITPEVTDLINASFAQKRASADEALAKKNWSRYIFLHERPYRIDAFEDVMDDMTDQEYWGRLSDIWVDSENIGAQPSRWRELLLSERGSRESFMNENERAELAKLPQKFTVYRGYSENDQEEFGMSWSTDAGVAEWFARRFARDDEKIIMENLEISKDDVFAYVTRRGEDEIILDMRNVVERTAKKQQLPRKPRTRIPSKNRNATPPGDSGAMSSLSNEQIDEMTQRYKDGDSVLELANDYSVTQGAVYYHLRRKGVARRPIGRPKKPGGFSAVKRRLKDSLGQIGLFAAFSNDPQKTLRSSNQMKTYLLSEPVRTPDDMRPDDFALRPNFVRAAIAAGLGLFKALNHKTFKVQGPIAREFTELMVGPKIVNDAIGTTYPTLQELGEIFAANAIVRARIRALFGIDDPTALGWAISSGGPLREGGERIYDIPDPKYPPYVKNLGGGGAFYFEGIENRRPFVLSVMANMPEAVRSKLYWDSGKIPYSKRDVPITRKKGVWGSGVAEGTPVDEVLPLFEHSGHDTSQLDLIKPNYLSADGAKVAQYVEMAKEEIRQWAADHDEWARRWAQSAYRIMSEAGLSDDEIAEVINRDWLQNITFGIGGPGDVLQNAMFMALLMTRSKFAPVVHPENGFDDPNLALHEFFHVHLGQGFTRHGEYVAFRGPAEVYDSWYPHTLFALAFNSNFWRNVVKESGGTEELRKEMLKAVEKMLAPEYDSDVRLLFELFPEYQRASAEARKKLNEMIMAEIIEDFQEELGFRRIAGMPRATEIINIAGFRIPKRLWPWGSSYGGKERIADVQGKTYAKFEERIFGAPDPTSGDGGNTGKMSLERTPKFDGGHSSRGRGTPLGDGKDVAMREVADSAIVELVGNRGSSSLTTLRFLGPYRAGSRVVMLARNGELRGVPLKNETRSAIANAQRNGARFVVGDMPDVDSQFVDFLEEIGADYTIYHAGNSPRFRPGSKIPGTNAGTSSETRAGESDSSGRSETIGRNLATAADEVVAAGFEVKVYGGRSDSQSGSNPVGGMLSALNRMMENPERNILSVAPTERKLSGLLMMMSAMEKYATDSTNQRLVVVSKGDRVVGASLIKFPEKDSVAELRYAGSLSPVRGVGSAMVAEIMRLAADSGRSIIGTSSQDSVSFWRGVGGKNADWDGPYRGNTIFEIDDVRKVVAAIDARRKELRAQKLLDTIDGGNPR